MTDLQIANEIRNQMYTLDKNLCWCMGTKNLRVIKRGLRFDVNGLSFKGTVQISLTGADLYDISFIKVRKTKDMETCAKTGVTRFNHHEEVFKKHEGIYFDQMMGILEQEVENRG